MTVATAFITAAKVPENRRLSITPRYLKHKFIVAEHTVYSMLRSMTKGYDGGYWHYFELSNNGFYMAPSDNRKMTLHTINGFEGEVSADAAGIITCLYVWNRLACDTEDDHFIELYHALLDYARQHPEATQIRRAID